MKNKIEHLKYWIEHTDHLIKLLAAQQVMKPKARKKLDPQEFVTPAEANAALLRFQKKSNELAVALHRALKDAEALEASADQKK